VHVQRLLRQTEEVVFCFDGDAAGKKAAWHALEVSLPNLADHKAIRFLFLPPEHDPDSFVRERGQEAFEQGLAEAQPLSSFFLDELKRRVDMTTLEGRSRLIHEAKPLLQKVAAPVLQLQLLKSLAETSGITQEEAARLCEIRVVRSSGGHPGRAAPARQERAPMQSLEVWLLKCLLVKAELAGELPMERFRGSGFESRALQEFVAFVSEISDPASGLDALVIERFQGTEFEALFRQLQQEAMQVNLTPEQVEAEFRDALPSLERLHVKERIDEWQRQAERRTLGPEECSQLAGLTQRLMELDRGRKSPPPVL
jgi:DNA primase